MPERMWLLLFAQATAPLAAATTARTEIILVRIFMTNPFK
jgi:hypothetical protein